MPGKPSALASCTKAVAKCPGKDERLPESTGTRQKCYNLATICGKELENGQTSPRGKRLSRAELPNPVRAARVRKEERRKPVVRKHASFRTIERPTKNPNVSGGPSAGHERKPLNGADGKPGQADDRLERTAVRARMQNGKAKPLIVRSRGLVGRFSRRREEQQRRPKGNCWVTHTHTHTHTRTQVSDGPGRAKVRTRSYCEHAPRKNDKVRKETGEPVEGRKEGRKAGELGSRRDAATEPLEAKSSSSARNRTTPFQAHC